MLSYTLALLMALAAVAHAHMLPHQIYVNGKAVPGREAGIRMPPSNGPVKDLNSFVLCHRHDHF